MTNPVTVGYGMGDFNDVTMEQLADQGDGFSAYVDTEDEAERLFEDEQTSALETVTKSVWSASAGKTHPRTSAGHRGRHFL